MFRTNLLVILSILITLTAFGCGTPQKPVEQPASVVEPPTPKPLAPVKLPVATLPDGFKVTLEMAETEDEVMQGLMFRSHLPEDRGMLFLFHTSRVPSFWMKNTLIPLDIIFLDPDGTVVDIAFNARPCKAEPCPQYVPKGPAQAVLEVGAGVAEAHGVTTGSRIGFQRVKGYPVEESSAGTDE